MDPYRVLFVHSSAPQAVIRAAYHALARLHHPDRSDDPEAERRMAELNLAYALVNTTEARTAYAREQNRGDRNHQVAPPPARRDPRPSGLQQAIRTRLAQATADAEASEGTVAQAPRAPVGDGVMDYGRYEGWRLEEIARTDRAYLEWLGRSPAGRRFRAEINRLLTAPVA